MKQSWKIVQFVCDSIKVHVDAELMKSLGYEGAKDYYPSKYIALCYAHRYQRACVNCGLSSENVYVVSGTNE